MSQRAGFISQFWFNIGPWNFSKGFRSEYSRQIKRLFHDFQKHTTIKKKVVSDLFEVNKIKLWLRFHLFVPAAKPINLHKNVPRRALKPQGVFPIPNPIPIPLAFPFLRSRPAYLLVVAVGKVFL